MSSKDPTEEPTVNFSNVPLSQASQDPKEDP